MAGLRFPRPEQPCVALVFLFTSGPVKLKPIKHIPVLIAGGIIVLVGLVQWGRLDFFEGLERTTYDMRARQALKYAPTVATNLGFVFIDDASIAFVRTNRVPRLHATASTGPGRFTAGWSRNWRPKAPGRLPLTSSSTNRARIIRRCGWRTAACRNRMISSLSNCGARTMSSSRCPRT